VSPLKNALDVLNERGFVEQSTDPEALRSFLEGAASCYVGFDPTADSLHVGHLLPIMALANLQRLGHRPIVLVGGGTGMVGDPSGKTEMRQILTEEMIERNVAGLKAQLSSFLEFGTGKASMVNNADWLLDLRYIEFLRDIGRHFSVNRMLAAESYRARLETGLNFIEFNYMLLQAYDFYYLSQNHDCHLQMGGNDQWGNIVAGIDLIRRKAGVAAHGLTFPLLTTAGGAKMGKTAAGAVWLDPHRTTPYDFYQFWVNTDDRDVARFLKLYTFLPMKEIEAVAGLEGRELNACKMILAFEVTSTTHGREKGLAAHEAAGRVFGKREVPEDLLPSSAIPRAGKDDVDSVPTTFLPRERFEKGLPAIELFVEVGLCDSKSAARRLIQQGGAYVNGDRLDELDRLIGVDQLGHEGVFLKAGKKRVHRVHVKP